MLTYLLIAVSQLLPLEASTPQTEAGIERLDDPAWVNRLEGKALGLITNPSAVSRRGRHLIDLLHEDSRFGLRALFAPEHALRGTHSGEEPVASGVDEPTGLPVRSLYGQTRKPTPEMLLGLDLLIFDIQDVGARFYTFVSTMTLAMEAAAEAGIPFLVLDRPNPIGGRILEGPVLDPAHRSFVGMNPIPLRHGMTVGELARMVKGEGWIEGAEKLELTVAPLAFWSRDQWFDQTGLPWVAPSPNLVDLETATVYPGVALLEGTNISDGRGTLLPILQIGAPWIDGTDLARELNGRGLPGIRFTPVAFSPRPLPGIASGPKYAGELCRGVRLWVTDREAFRAVRTGLELIDAIRDLYPRTFRWREDLYIDQLAGTAALREGLEQGLEPIELVRSWEPGLKAFQARREPYLLYE